MREPVGRRLPGLLLAILLPALATRAHAQTIPEQPRGDYQTWSNPVVLQASYKDGPSPDATGSAAREPFFVEPTPQAERTNLPWRDNFSVLGGIDGAKGPEDLGISANFGFRFAVQTAGPLVADWGLGLQIGTGVNYHRTATRFLHLDTGVRDRDQWFSTIGLFQRTDCGINWGIAYDVLAEHYYSDFTLGQWRAQIGYQIDETSEIGVWGTLRERGDSVLVSRTPLTVEPINQYALFLRHIWPTGVMTRGWLGLAEEHGRFILGGPAYTQAHHPFLFGADVYIPLSDSWAIFGEANFITPNDSGTVTAFLGLVYYPSATAGTALRNRFAPLLPIANNPSFGVNVVP